MQLAWGNKVSNEFRVRLWRLCENLAWGEEHASWLMACIAWESGESFSASIKNMAGSGATGLIQFMPSTAKDLKTTVDLLSKMSAVEQLDYVEKYFFRYAPKIHTLADMYMAILMPKYITSPSSIVLFTDGTTAYRQNSGLDSNTDGRITKEECAGKVNAKLLKGLKHPLVWEGGL